MSTRSSLAAEADALFSLVQQVRLHPDRYTVEDVDALRDLAVELYSHACMIRLDAQMILNETDRARIHVGSAA